MCGSLFLQAYTTTRCYVNAAEDYVSAAIDYVSGGNAAGGCKRFQPPRVGSAGAFTLNLAVLRGSQITDVRKDPTTPSAALPSIFVKILTHAHPAAGYVSTAIT
jgi:hypothetical protein